MNIVELMHNDMKKDLTNLIMKINFDECSKEELNELRTWALDKEKRADILTMEDEFVGYTYTNLAVLEKKYK